MGALQIGLLIGGQKVDAAGAILSCEGLDLILSGKSRLSGSANLTIGVGVSGKAAGGKGGIQVLMVSSNKGAYFGGSFEGLRISADQKLNREAYGPDFDLNKIIKNKGGAYQPADNIRAMLEKAAHEAVWGKE
jgi:lipid-binding SYLF domain-containing protein